MFIFVRLQMRLSFVALLRIAAFMYVLRRGEES